MDGLGIDSRYNKCHWMIVSCSWLMANNEVGGRTNRGPARVAGGLSMGMARKRTTDAALIELNLRQTINVKVQTPAIRQL